MNNNRNWEHKRIGDVCTVERGGSPRPIDSFITDDPDGINWIKIGDTDDSMFITRTAQKIIPEGMKKSRYVQPGDFLLSNSMSFGRPYILKIDGCIHDGWLVLRDNDNTFDKRFLYYYLSAKPTYEKFKRMAVGGVVNNLNSEMVRNVDVPLPKLEEQSSIADLLDKLNLIICARTKELKHLDELIKARFVEMFGNPVKNTMGWETKPLGSLATKIGSGATPKGGKESYREDGISLIRSMNVRNAEFDYKDLAHISDEQASKLDNVIIEENDVLLNITGASVARSCIAPDDVLPARVNQHVCIIRCRNYIDPIFLNRLLTDDNYQDLLWGIAGSGATREAITKQQVESLTIITPQRELQESFAQFVAQVDKSKVVVQKALDEAQLLFDSLMQEYFG